jgi:hypothetical protein
MGIFERYLSLWVASAIAVGVGLGLLFPPAFEVVSRVERALRQPPGTVQPQRTPSCAQPIIRPHPRDRAGAPLRSADPLDVS